MDQKEITLAERVGGLKTIKDDRYVNEHTQDYRKTHKKNCIYLYTYFHSHGLFELQGIFFLVNNEFEGMWKERS